jgi:hypothetical protein
VGFGLGILFILLLTAEGWPWYRSSRAQWAIVRALPQIERLADSLQYAQAYDLAMPVSFVLRSDPHVENLLSQISAVVSLKPACRVRKWHMRSTRTPTASGAL